MIAIGDIHGCLHALATLLEAVTPGPEDLDPDDLLAILATLAGKSSAG
jgi:hypothetical protein